MTTSLSRSSISNPTALLVDFEDSFTGNIAAELYALGVACKLVPHSRAKEAFAQLPGQRRCLILGPGPGHPDEHAHLYPWLREMHQHPETFILGICLGHQLWWAAHGAQVLRGRPVHGQSFPLEIPQWPGVFPQTSWGRNVQVQRYNSLSVGIDNSQGPNSWGEVYVRGELMMSYGPGFLTYQFHPESVGTSCPKTFMQPVRDFLYNIPHGERPRFPQHSPVPAH